MIIWTGWGILVPFIGLGIPAIFQGLFGQLFGNNTSSFVGYAVAGAVLWLWGKKLNGDKGRVVIDKKTKEEIILKKRHTLFFIPIQYWAFAALLLAATALLTPTP